MKSWHEMKDEFHGDRSHKYLYIKDISPETWNKVIDLIRCSGYELEFSHGNKIIELPYTISEIKLLQEIDSTCLKIWLDETISINCYFLKNTEVEMELSSHAIATESDYILLTSFLDWLSKSTNKRVNITQNTKQK